MAGAGLAGVFFAGAAFFAGAFFAVDVRAGAFTDADLLLVVVRARVLAGREGAARARGVMSCFMPGMSCFMPGMSCFIPCMSCFIPGIAGSIMPACAPDMPCIIRRMAVSAITRSRMTGSRIMRSCICIIADMCIALMLSDGITMAPCVMPGIADMPAIPGI